MDIYWTNPQGRDEKRGIKILQALKGAIFHLKIEDSDSMIVENLIDEEFPIVLRHEFNKQDLPVSRNLIIHVVERKNVRAKTDWGYIDEARILHKWNLIGANETYTLEKTSKFACGGLVY